MPGIACSSSRANRAKRRRPASGTTPNRLWLGRLAGGRGVGVQGLPAVWAGGGPGAIGVVDDLPAPAVNTDIMMKLTQKGTISYGCLAAVALVADVVDVAGAGGAVAAAGPGAVLVPEDDGAADGRGDGVGPPDVEGLGRGIPGLVEQAPAQDGGDPGGAGHEVDRQPGDRVPQCPPRFRRRERGQWRDQRRGRGLWLITAHR